MMRTIYSKELLDRIEHLLDANPDTEFWIFHSPRSKAPALHRHNAFHRTHEMVPPGALYTIDKTECDTRWDPDLETETVTLTFRRSVVDGETVNWLQRMLFAIDQVGDTGDLVGYRTSRERA